MRLILGLIGVRKVDGRFERPLYGLKLDKLTSIVGCDRV